MTSQNEQPNGWQAVEELLRRSESLAAAGRFAAEVMHELNNPLDAACNLAFLLEEDADDPGKVRHYAGLLQEQLSQLTRISRQTLNFYRTGTHRPIDIVQVTNAALRVHERKIADKRLRLQTAFTDGATVSGSPGEILQVLTNLLANSLDALPNGGTLAIRVRKCNSEVHVIVADNGHGMTAAVLPHVFEPFFTTKEDRGTGLGLAISKSIIDAHRGRIRTRSCTRPGRSGTAFRISLPCHPENGPPDIAALAR